MRIYLLVISAVISIQESSYNYRKNKENNSIRGIFGKNMSSTIACIGTVPVSLYMKPLQSEMFLPNGMLGSFYFPLEPIRLFFI